MGYNLYIAVIPSGDGFREINVAAADREGAAERSLRYGEGNFVRRKKVAALLLAALLAFSMFGCGGDETHRIRLLAPSIGL